MAGDIKSIPQTLADYAGYASMGVLGVHRGRQLVEDINRFATKTPKATPYKIGHFSKKTTMALSVLSMPMVISHTATAIEHIQSGQYTFDDIYALSGAIFLGVNLATTLFDPKSRLVAGVKLATFIGGAAVDIAGLITAETKEDFLTQLVMVVLFNSERGGPARNLVKGAYDLVGARLSRPDSRGEGTLPVQPATISRLAAGLLAGVLYVAYPSPAHAAEPPRPPVPHQGGIPVPDGAHGDVVIELTKGRRRRHISFDGEELAAVRRYLSGREINEDPAVYLDRVMEKVIEVELPVYISNKYQLRLPLLPFVYKPDYFSTPILDRVINQIQAHHQVLVIGSGSGFEAVAIAKQKGAHVDAVDYNPFAVFNTRLTARANNMDHLAEVPPHLMSKILI